MPLPLSWGQLFRSLAPPNEHGAKIVAADSAVDHLCQIRDEQAWDWLPPQSAGDIAALQTITEVCEIDKAFFFKYALQCPRCNSYSGLHRLIVYTADDCTEPEHKQRQCCVCFAAVPELSSGFFIMPCCMSTNADSCICEDCLSSWCRQGALTVRAKLEQLAWDFTELGMSEVRNHGRIKFLFTNVGPNTHAYLDFFQWKLEPNARNKLWSCLHCQQTFKGCNSVLEALWHMQGALEAKAVADTCIRRSEGPITRRTLEAHVHSKLATRRPALEIDRHMVLCGIARALGRPCLH